MSGKKLYFSSSTIMSGFCKFSHIYIPYESYIGEHYIGRMKVKMNF